MADASDDRAPRRPRDHAGVVTYPPLLFAGPFALGWALHRLAPVPLLPASVGGDARAALRLVGVALVLVGLAIAGWSVLTLRAHRTAVDPFGATTALVTAGPFARSRNPIYVAMALVHAGLACVAQALAPAAVLPLALWAVQAGVIRREERYLALKFGAEYRDYCRRVRRWV